MSDLSKLRAVREALSESLPDAAATAGVRSVTSPAGDSATMRTVPEILGDIAAVRAAEAATINGGPLIMVPRLHRA